MRKLEAVQNRAPAPHSFTTFSAASTAALEEQGQIRDELGSRLDLLEKNAYRFCYINDFPMSGTAQDLMYGAPSEITEQQLREVHIKVRD